MTEEQRTTTYLYQFATAGLDATDQAFQRHLQRLHEYEQQMQEAMARMEGRQGQQQQTTQQTAAPPSMSTAVEEQNRAIQQSIAITQQYEQQQRRVASAHAQVDASIDSGLGKLTQQKTVVRDGRVELESFERKLDDVNKTVIRGQTSFNNFGREIERVSQVSKTIDGTRITDIEIDEQKTVGPLTELNETLIEGNRRVLRYRNEFGDAAKTVEQGTVYFNRAGKEIGRTVTTTHTASDGVRRMTTEMQGLNRVTEAYDVLGTRFVRHLTWIAQGIIAWAAIGAVTDAIREWYEVQTLLNSALADFQMRVGATPAQTDAFRQSVLSISTATATPLSELAPVAPYAPDESTLRFAAELNRVAGGNLQNQMQWLVAQQRQFNREGDDTVDILNAMSTAWTQTTLPMDQFVTMLRDAAPLSEEFKLSMEEIYALFGALQAVTGAEGRELDYLARNLANLYDPRVQRELGVVSAPIDPQTLAPVRRDMISVLDELNEKIRSGELSFEKLAESVGASGRRQRQLLQAVMLDWEGVEQSIRDTTAATGEWDSFLSTALGKNDAKLDAVKAAWDSLMATVGDTSVWRETLDTVADGLNAWVGILERVKTLFTEIDPLTQILLEANPVFGPLFRERERDKFTEQSEFTKPGRYSSFGPTGISSFGEPSAGSGQPALAAFPSMMTVPQGVDWSEVQASMDAWTQAIAALGPEFEAWIAQNQQQVLIYDENTKTLQVITAFLPALQRAIQENTQAQKTRELQPGLRNVDMNLDQQGGLLQQWIAYYTQFLERMGYPQESRPQLIMGEDDTWLRLWASNEALMLAIRALTEATEDQTDALTGMWNVPEGATMWVPIQSLFYSRQRGGGVSMPELPPPPDELPEQQPGWMDLPGAVESMSVNTMSVASLEGLQALMQEREGPTGFIEGMKSAVEQIFALRDRVMDAYERATDPNAGRAQNVNQWVDAFHQAVAAFRERSGGVGAPEPEWSGMSVEELISSTRISTMELQSSNTEVQSAATEMMTPSTDIDAASTFVQTPIADLMATSVELSAITLSGMDFGNLEYWLALIYDAITALDINPPISVPGVQGSGGGGGGVLPGVPGAVAIEVDGEILGRLVNRQTYQNQSLQTRIKSSF